MSFRHWLHRVDEKVSRQVHASVHQFEGFTHRATADLVSAHNQLFRNVEHGTQRSFIYTVKESPYITAVAAFIVNLIPVIGWIVSAAIVAIGTEVNRFTGYLAARYEGMTTQEARNYGRTIAHRNLVSGMIGSAIGGIFAALGVTFGGAAAESASGGAEELAGEGGHFNSAAFSLQGESSLEADASANVLNTITPYDFAPATEPNFAAQLLPTGYAQAEALGGSPGFFSNAWNWITSNPEKLLTGAATVAGKIFSKVAPQPGTVVNFGYAGLGSGGLGDPGGPGIGGASGGLGWDDIEAAAESFFSKYGEFMVIALAFALVLVMIAR